MIVDAQRVPDFLVIGAMKSGTTTLYNDLKVHPQIVLSRKELNCLSDPQLSDSDTNTVYQKQFHSAGNGQLCGDVSTTYSMLPDKPGCAERARRLLTPNLKIVYLVREPTSRCVSHHYHMYSRSGSERMEPDIDHCIRHRDEIINYSRYWMQLAPWRDAFGDDSIHVILFEKFISDRRRSLNALCRFLQIGEYRETIDFNAVYNRSDGKHVLSNGWARFWQSALYQRMLRPIIPRGVVEFSKTTLLPEAPPRPRPPRLETVERIIAAAENDERALRSFLGSEKPLWDFPAVRQQYREVILGEAA